MGDFLLFIFKKNAFIYSIFGVLLPVLPEIRKRRVIQTLFANDF